MEFRSPELALAMCRLRIRLVLRRKSKAGPHTVRTAVASVEGARSALSQGVRTQRAWGDLEEEGLESIASGPPPSPAMAFLLHGQESDWMLALGYEALVGFVDRLLALQNEMR